MKSMRNRASAIGMILLLLVFDCSTAASEESASRRPVQNSIAFLAAAMDRSHNCYPVYDDIGSAANHFCVYTRIPDADAPVSMNAAAVWHPHSGATAIRCVFKPGGEGFGGYYFLNGILPPLARAPLPNFGTVPDAGVDLTGAVRLTFWAKGQSGGERIEFFMGGVGWDPLKRRPVAPYPDSTPRVPAVGMVTTLSRTWQKYVINVSGHDLHYILGGFGWMADLRLNPAGAVFYVDDISYELTDAARARRLNEPRFLKSYFPGPGHNLWTPGGHFDMRMENAAFTYDNAVALLAFLADGSKDSLRRARLIGDAFVYASVHDRFFTDGRLRSIYSCGDIALPPGWYPNNRPDTVPIPSYYDPKQQKFYEIGQKTIDTGDNAWAMIALLSLYRHFQNPAYLVTARKLGNFIHTFRSDTGRYRGFTAGLSNYPESVDVKRRSFASTEHNLDVAAAFSAMFQITGEAKWRDDAQYAREFTEAMWDPKENRYRTGTINPNALNYDPGEIPLDAQAWSILVFPDTVTRHPDILSAIERDHRTGSDGFSGFDFNNDKDGVWFEGTAQMAIVYALAGRCAASSALRAELERAQQTPPFGDGRGIASVSRDGVTTGYGFAYFRRRHIAATAWNVFAQLGYNPFYQVSQKKCLK